MDIFKKGNLNKLYKPAENSRGEQNGQVTIVGGSELFHGAPLLSLKVASRIVDMVFFASPHKPLKAVISRLKAGLSSFIWVPWDEVDAYIEKSDAVLVGPGFMRFASEKRQVTSDKLDEAGKETYDITKRLLLKFPNTKWVIDAGSLQVMEPEWIPENAVLTPNRMEFESLFKSKIQISNVKLMAKKYNCIIVAKGLETIVCSPRECVLVRGGNAGLTKGGTGDVLAGLTVTLLAKNEPFLAATSASYIAKFASDELYKKVGTNYNADDLAERIPNTFQKLQN